MTLQPYETSSSLAIRADQDDFTPQQVAALRHIGAEDASDDDLRVFFHQCQRTGLDPFARQIYLVGRNEWDSRTRTSSVKFTIQTGIDGFRLIARRAADAAREPFGYEDTLWCDESGRWRDVWLSDTPPTAAKVTVIRNGQRFPAIALFREYAGTKKDGGLTRMWAEKGALMIAKCAEALALRKAFPQDLSGLYTSDEMNRANMPDHGAPAAHSAVQAPPAAPAAPPPTATLDDLLAEPVDAEVIDADTGELLPDWAEDVNEAETLESLRAVWDAYPQEHGNPAFKGAVNARKADLS